MSSTDLVMGAAGGSGAPATYIEDVFSTYLYTGNGSTQTINNGIDLAGEGGLNWIKSRSNTGFDHNLTDTARGVQQTLATNTTAGQFNYSGGVTAFTSSGFTVADGNYTNANAATYASWTFRKQPKFFDIVTYAGNGVNNRAIPHSLGSAPGVVIVKRISGTENWPVWHRSVSSGGAGNLYLNLTLGLAGAKITDADATTFTVIADTPVNEVGSNYVAYLFAHNAGGFGESGTDNAISCGSVTTPNSGGYTSVNLGYEPQFVLLKQTSGAGGSWFIFDVMRGMSQTQGLALRPNLANAEFDFGAPVPIIPTATGFNISNDQFLNNTYIYMAIRRPMKVPTDATTVFNPVIYTGDGSANRVVSTTVRPDVTFWTSRDGSAYQGTYLFDRLRGVSKSGGGNGGGLKSATTDAEYGNASYQISALNNNSVQFGSSSGSGGVNYPSLPGVMWNFSRQPGFFDEVLLNSSQTTYNHLLGVAPNMIWVKCTNASGANWVVYSDSLSDPNNQYLRLNTTGTAGGFTGAWSVNSTQFSVASGLWANGTAGVAYLFATCPGVSKVGSYSGTGANTTNQIDCGFTAGARFVMIKRTNATGNWYVFDTARGITSGNDPFLALNTTNAENSSYDCITPYSAGFNINDASNVGLNETGGSYIYLAIA